MVNGCNIVILLYSHPNLPAILNGHVLHAYVRIPMQLRMHRLEYNIHLSQYVLSMRVCSS